MVVRKSEDWRVRVCWYMGGVSERKGDYGENENKTSTGRRALNYNAIS